VSLKTFKGILDAPNQDALILEVNVGNAKLASNLILRHAERERGD
jgi:hypothetical protein